MPQPPPSWNRRLGAWPHHLGGSARFLWFASALAVAAFALVRFPPSLYAFYPKCPIQSLLHIQCPGCGTTRALATLLHGHLLEALRLNALTTCALPALAIAAIFRFVRSLLGHPPHPWKPSLGMRYASFAVIALFTLIRNL